METHYGRKYRSRSASSHLLKGGSANADRSLSRDHGGQGGPSVLVGTEASHDLPIKLRSLALDLQFLNKVLAVLNQPFDDSNPGVDFVVHVLGVGFEGGYDGVGEILGSGGGELVGNLGSESGVGVLNGGAGVLNPAGGGGGAIELERNVLIVGNVGM